MKPRLLVFLFIASFTPSLASVVPDPPDSAVNPQSEGIEIADPVWTGTDHDIHYVVKPRFGSSLDVSVVTDHPLDDRQPRLAIGPQGDAWVTWWRDDAVDRVLVRKRLYADGSWSAERDLSLEGEGSRAPVAIHDGTRAWVAYECDAAEGSGVGVVAIIDEPDPIPTRSLVGTSTHAGPLDVRLEAEGGHLWVSWIDGPSDLGWSEYDAASETWSVPLYESYAADDVAAARERVRDEVLAD